MCNRDERAGAEELSDGATRDAREKVWQVTPLIDSGVVRGILDNTLAGEARVTGS
jgi:hypothetical protein